MLGAGAVKFTLQLPPCPGPTDVGVQESCAIAEGSGESEIVADAELEPDIVRTVAACTAEMVAAVAEKLAEIAPAGTSTEAGTASAVPAVDVIEIGAPLAVAALARVTAQIVLMFEVRVEAVH